MKWEIPAVEPKIDHFIERYHVEMDSSIPVGENIFDYRAAFLENRIQLYKFSDAQQDAQRFVEDHMYDMCNLEEYGSVTFRPTIDEHIRKVKPYQELCHRVMCRAPPIT